jgi:chromosome segregation ATPase
VAEHEVAVATATSANVTQHHGEIDELVREVESLKEQVEGAQRDVHVQKTECTKLRTTVDDLETKLVALSASYDDVTEKKRSLQQELSRATSELQLLEKEHLQSASSSSELLNRCMDAEAKASKAISDLATLDEEVYSLRGQNDILKSQVQQLEEDLDTHKNTRHRDLMSRELHVTTEESAANPDDEAAAQPQEVAAATDPPLAEEGTCSADERDELVMQLIETKMQAASYAYETDLERKKVFALKRRLQIYAERVANLEVSIAEALNPVDISRRGKKR